MKNQIQVNLSESDSQNSLRINRALAERGVCSRRKAEELIKSGKVRVDGVLITDLAVKISPDSEIVVDDVLFPLRTKTVFFAINKPVAVITSMRDPQGRKTVFDLLPDSLKSLRPYPVGRLDFFSEGLLLMTNDGKLAQELAHPRYEKEKIYEVLIRGPIPAEAIRDMSSGLKLADGVRFLPVTIKSRQLPDGNSLLIMTLKQGLNRQIRKMCAKWNLVILRLKRVSIGRIKLGSLKPGEIRMLNPDEFR